MNRAESILVLELFLSCNFVRIAWFINSPALFLNKMNECGLTKIRCNLPWQQKPQVAWHSERVAASQSGAISGRAEPRVAEVRSRATWARLEVGRL